MPGLSFGDGFGPELTSEILRHPDAATSRADRPNRPAGAILNVHNPGAFDFSSAALPSFPADQVRTLYDQCADQSAVGLPCHEAGNDNAGCAAYAAAPPGDTCLPNNAAGRWAAERAPEQSGDPTGPILFDAAPIHGPSADPSGAAHSTAIRENTWEVAGSSKLVYAG